MTSNVLAQSGIGFDDRSARFGGGYNAFDTLL
jgi:hypothetical protein